MGAWYTIMRIYSKFCESCPVIFCPNRTSDIHTVMFSSTSRELLTTHSHTLRVICRLQEYQYVIYNNFGVYQKHKNFKDLRSTIDALLMEPSLTLEETLALIKLKGGNK